MVLLHLFSFLLSVKFLLVFESTTRVSIFTFFVKKLLAKGRKVAVVSRGYRGKRKRD